MSNPSLGQHPRHPLGHPRSQQPRHHSALYPRRPTEYPSYSPNHASSSTALSSEGAGASSTPKGALKVFSSVKRSFSMSATKKSPPSSFPTMSTAEETAAAQIRLSDSEPSRPPPTVQQIAAGLVTGLRPRTSSRPRAPPPRSSLKKSITSSTSTSSSTSLASTSLMSTRTGSTTTAATSVASSHRRFSLKDALFGRSAPIAPTTTASRKAVRFHVGSPNSGSSPLPL